MPTQTLTATAAVEPALEQPMAMPAPDGTSAEGPSADRIVGLRCRNCGRQEGLGVAYVCAACFGPLEVEYDLRLVAGRLDRATIERRAPGIWRYLELLPVTEQPRRSLAVGSTPLVRAERLGPVLGIDDLWLKDDSRNPTLSFKDRAVAVAAARAREFGITTLACASTGNLAGATAAAAAALGMPAYVFIPHDLERAKVDHALAYGATVVPIDGTYDDVNRLCLEIADETGWGFVNINLRPFYAEGSKTLAFEIAESLGWQAPDVVVAPIASGAMFTKLAKGFRELVELGLIEERPIRFVGGQAAGCSPVATAWERGTTVIEPVRRPDTIVRSLAIGNPADGRYSVALANESKGSIEAVADETTVAAIRQLAAQEGIYAETTGGVTVAAAVAARRRGLIRDGDRVVALITGNGLKTPDARTFGLPDGEARPGEAGLAPVLGSGFAAFERWLEGGA